MDIIYLLMILGLFIGLGRPHAGRRAAGDGSMNITYVLAGVLALLLLCYLIYALVRAECF